MPIPPLLTLNAFGSLPLQVHELTAGTTPEKIGSDISTGSPAVFVPGVVVKANMQGYSKMFKGERYCLTITAGNLHIRREDEGGAGVWGIVHTFAAGASLNSPETTGLQIVRDGNDIALVAAYVRGAADAVVWAKSNDGAAWTEVSVNPGFFPRITSTTVVFRNRLYFADMISSANPTRTYEIDPAAGSLTVIDAPWLGLGSGNFGTADLCVHDDRLFAVAVDAPGSGNGVLNLYEFTGGAWVLNSQIGNTLGHNDNSDGQASKYVLWTDNTNLYVIGYTEKDEADTAAQVGSTVWQGVPAGASFTWTQDDGTMRAALRPNARGLVTAARQDRFSIYVDNDTDPANPAFYVIVAQGPAPGTGHAIWRWEGFGFEMGSGVNTGEVGPGPSVSVAFALPEVKHGGAEAISQAQATYGEIEDQEKIVGGYRLSYRTPNTVAGLTGRVWYSLGQGPPDQLAQLVGGGTTFGPITGDNRVALRTIDIDLAASGITAPDESNWMIQLTP